MVRVVEERDGHLIWVDIGRGGHVPGTRAGDTCMEKLDRCAMMPLNVEEAEGGSLCCYVCPISMYYCAIYSYKQSLSSII